MRPGLRGWELPKLPATKPRGLVVSAILYGPAKTHAAFDDGHLITCAGLVPVMRPAERCGLAGQSAVTAVIEAHLLLIDGPYQLTVGRAGVTDN